MDVVWKLIICLTLFSVAGFIKCSLARLLSYQFYRTAHFQKVKQAIERVSDGLASGSCSLWQTQASWEGDAALQHRYARPGRPVWH
jgi:hypothetical protein